MDELHAQRKKIWQRSRINHMTYAEIAATLGIGKDAVNKSLQAASKNIANYIIKHQDILSVLLFLFF
ncbi:sigma factor-like helix-turn-helix DNA-binding protein [Chitinophaga costaii]|uniref:sigma factor-like helix-turn-helix DNA-binding protein n=1 Tax=Chitinophaga costaii TaxID=1335309 RepID=UPI0037433F4A